MGRSRKRRFNIFKNQRWILKKKIVKLNGGLGNQMFQWAFAYSLVKKFYSEVVFDFSFFEEIKTVHTVAKREFELDVFNFDCQQASEEDLQQVILSNHRPKFQKFLWRKFKMNKFKPSGNSVIERSEFNVDEEVLLPEYYYYEGYFQNEKYFKHLRKDLLNLFSLKVPLDEKNQKMQDKIIETNSVSLHIRRGDYVNLDYVNKFHGLCSMEYYKKAVDYIAKRVKSPHFFIFSDDIEWVIKNLKIDYPFTVVDFNQGKGCFDMNLMKHCKHNIVANSSFSWWGAWLNNDNSKIVIAPKNWISKNENCSIIPKNWIKM
jgi:hypothetical protein